MGTHIRYNDRMQSLGKAIDELAAVEHDALSDDEVHELVIGLQREVSRLAAASAHLLAAWDARRVWAGDGSKSAAARLGRECDLSAMSARRELRRARKLRTMPATAGALAGGKASVDPADPGAFANPPAPAP